MLKNVDEALDACNHSLKIDSNFMKGNKLHDKIIKIKKKKKSNAIIRKINFYYF